MAQSGSALDWGSSGRRFESSRPDQSSTKSRGDPAALLTWAPKVQSRISVGPTIGRDRVATLSQSRFHSPHPRCPSVYSPAHESGASLSSQYRRALRSAPQWLRRLRWLRRGALAVGPDRGGAGWEDPAGQRCTGLSLSRRAPVQGKACPGGHREPLGGCRHPRRR